jgi:hypothetical protein
MAEGCSATSEVSRSAWWPPRADDPPGIEFRPIENIPDAVSFCVARSGSPLMRPASLLWEMLRREAEASGEF